jgi:hypothetical protein
MTNNEQIENFEQLLRGMNANQYLELIKYLIENTDGAYENAL